jgi:hypothetical protein
MNNLDYIKIVKMWLIFFFLQEDVINYTVELTAYIYFIGLIKFW